MNNTEQNEQQALVSGVFWGVGGLGLIWNLLGLLAFSIHMMITPEMIAVLPEADRAVYESYPAWLNIPYALAVLGGAFGCLALLFRKKIAVILLTISLVSVLIQNFYILVISEFIQKMGLKAAAMPTLVIMVAIVLFFYSRTMQAKKILN